LIFLSLHRMRGSGERSAPFGQIALLGDELPRPEHDFIQRPGKIPRPRDCLSAAVGQPTTLTISRPRMAGRAVSR
jgi:hypothetical protein